MILKHKNSIYFICFFLISLLFVLFILGSNNFVLDEYLYSNNSDLISDQLALKFFINDNWHFPLGKNPNYGIDVGNSIVFSGAVPLLSFISKLFANYLPENFQFLSIWFVLCFLFQLIFGYLIINHLTKNNFFSFISSLIFIFSPIFLFRIPIHISLIAHWLLLICFYFEIKNYHNLKIRFYSFVLPLSLLVHFYFLPMIMIIKYSFIIKDFLNKKNLSNTLKEIFIPLVVLIITAYIAGYFQISGFDAMGYGYGYYSFNLSGLIDPQPSSNSLNWSLFLSDIKNTKGQVEGFSYLGVGGIILFSAIIINYFKNKIKLSFLPYGLIIIFCLILSVSNIIYFGNILIFEYQLNKIIYGIASIIRASGRFIWIIYYIILIFGVYSIYNLFKDKKKSTIVISIIIALQIIDISPGLKNYYNSNAYKEKTITNESKKFWLKLSNNYNIIRTTHYKNSSNIFPSIGNQILSSNFIKSDVSRLGRYDRSKASKNRNKVYFALNNKLLNKNTVYAIDNENHLRYLKYLYSSDNVGFVLKDNVWLMIPEYKDKMRKIDHNLLKKFNLIELQENTYHKFNSQKSNNALGFGWTFSKENNGVWSEGNEMNIIFSFKTKLIKNYNLKVNINDVMLDSKKILNGSIILNGKKIKDFKLYDRNKTFLEIPISVKNYEKNIYKIDILIDNPTSPLELLKSADGRMLGVLIEGIELN